MKRGCCGFPTARMRNRCAARHQALSILRRRKRESGWEDVSQLEIAAPERSDSPHDFAALLARLPLEQREVLALKVWEELTFAEIAAPEMR